MTNIFELAYLQLKRERKLKSKRFGSLFVKRAVKIRDTVVKKKIDLTNLTDDTINRVGR